MTIFLYQTQLKDAVEMSERVDTSGELLDNDILIDGKSRDNKYLYIQGVHE